MWKTCFQGCFRCSGIDWDAAGEEQVMTHWEGALWLICDACLKDRGGWKHLPNLWRVASVHGGG